jgi:hypothetical protein
MTRTVILVFQLLLQQDSFSSTFTTPSLMPPTGLGITQLGCLPSQEYFSVQTRGIFLEWSRPYNQCLHGRRPLVWKNSRASILHLRHWYLAVSA